VADPGASRRVGTVVVLVLLAAALAGRTCGAVEVWMPETGEVNLDEVPRDSLEARFKHAAALMGGGDPMSGVLLLRNLVAESPDAQWVEQARYLIAFGLFTHGRYEKAFREWAEFLTAYPESEREDDAREMQLKAATLRAEENLDDGLALFDKLIDDGQSREFAAPNREAAGRWREFAVRCQKEKADAIMRAEDYLLAREEYAVVLEYDPDSAWAPYCWYKVAECELELNMWLRRGTEHLRRAGRAFRDFIAFYPEHELADAAREKLVQVDVEQAARYKVIAEYYLGPARRPAASLPYLQYLRTELPDTDEAKWAAEKMEKILADPSIQVQARYRRLELPGVRPTEPKETVEEAEEAGQQSAVSSE
jgi:outer membrane protein assembly factor BamD (BamD/ComL family)